MKPESIVQLIGSGNAAAVEEVWMNLIDAPDVSVEHIATFDAVLRELCRIGQESRAAEFAWAAVETLGGRFSPAETLKCAGPFLLAVGDSDELRGLVVKLYRSAYAEQEGLDALLDDAGLGGGRPVRRALRTLDVCLELEDGQFLAERDGLGAARVEQIDRGCWRISITSADGPETLGAVHLADRFQRASSTGFRVMRQFAPDALVARLGDDPASVVMEVCRCHGGNLDSHTLEAILVPSVLSAAAWKKWWTKARTALRRCPNLKIDGRSPYYLSYVDAPVALEDGFLDDFRRARVPALQFAAVEKYRRECKSRGQTPQGDTLRKCMEHFLKRAQQLAATDAPEAGRCWLMARSVALSASIADGLDGAIEFFKTAGDLHAVLGPVDDEGLLELACDCLVEARPDDWQRLLLDLIPTFPQSLCDKTATRLVEAGCRGQDFDSVVQTIIASPAKHFEALLWLWTDPSRAAPIPVPGPVAVLSRVIRALEDARREENTPTEVARRISARARAVLSARGYERLDQCLDSLEPRMAIALHTRIRQLDNLGRVVRGEMMSRLRRRFPADSEGAEAHPWLLEDVLYVTAEGLAKKQNEIEHHVNVKMKANSVAIGNAAERGDLSENSEYKFALEERDLLRARLGQMNAEVAMARVLAPNEIVTDCVGIGTKVSFRRVDDGDEYELSLLGPWEADAEKHRLNYRTPLAQKVLGKRVGEVVEFSHSAATGQYEIVAIQNAIAQSDWWDN